MTDELDDLRDVGVQVEGLEAWQDQAEETLEEGGDEPFELLPENALAFEVFTNCRMQRVSASDGMQSYWIVTGIEASEIVSVCGLLGVPEADRHEVLKAVRYLEAIALPELNRRD